MDIIDPGESFSLADYKNLAMDAIKDILSRKKLPIIVGGTGLYIRALVDNLDIPKVAPSKKLRKELAKKTPAELADMLLKIDPAVASGYGGQGPATAKKIDLKNPRRVLRALEVFILSGESFLTQSTKSKPIFNVLEIGIDWPRDELYARIDARVDKQMVDGLLEETKMLAQKKYKWDLPSMSGIGYKQMGFYLRGEATLEEAVALLKRDTRRYAKRQMTWFRNDKKIKWLNSPDLKGATSLVKKFFT